jgi:type VI secretion system Hcp family effector
MTRHVLFAAAGLCVLTAAQLARADSIVCSYTAAGGPSGISVAANGSSNSFEIDDISFDLEQGLSTETQIAARAGKVSFNPFTITKKLDKASPKLLQMAAGGSLFASVNCAFYSEALATGVAANPYLTAIVTNAKISKFKIQKAADGTPQTSISFMSHSSHNGIDNHSHSRLQLRP